MFRNQHHHYQVVHLNSADQSQHSSENSECLTWPGEWRVKALQNLKKHRHRHAHTHTVMLCNSLKQHSWVGWSEQEVEKKQSGICRAVHSSGQTDCMRGETHYCFNSDLWLHTLCWFLCSMGTWVCTCFSEDLECIVYVSFCALCGRTRGLCIWRLSPLMQTTCVYYEATSPCLDTNSSECQFLLNSGGVPVRCPHTGLWLKLNFNP